MTIAMQPIYTQTLAVGSATNTLAFNNIPQTFTDLQLVISARVTLSTASQAMYVQFNTDSGLNYSGTTLRGTGASANSYRSSSNNAFLEIDLPNELNTANTYSNLSIYIPNYTSSNFKQVIIDDAKESNSASTETMLILRANLWRSTSPITKIDIGTNITAPNFAGNSTFTLYGITKG